MIQLASRLDKISEPQTIMMAKMSRELRAKGEIIIDLSLGEPDFDTPLFIKEAAKKAIDAGFTKYPPVAGYPELRQAIVNKLSTDNGLTYNTDEVMVSNGAKQCIANVFSALLNDGDEVLIPSPYWVTYGDIVKMVGGIVKEVHGSIDQDFKITPEQLRSNISSKTKAIIYSNPCNPTGSVYTENEIKALAEVLKDFPNIIILSDEIYEYINFVGKTFSIAEIEGFKERTVIINGLSKAYAMTGWRLGYIAGPKEIVKACENIQSQTTSGVNAMTQQAAITALNAGKETATEMINAFHQRRDYMVEQLNTIPGFKCNNPSGAFYVFPDISNLFGKSYQDKTINTALDLCMFFLHVAKVSVVTGEAFGDKNCIRFSYATSMENLQNAIAQIRKAVTLLQ
jgi:aspartate aminotransferase